MKMKFKFILLSIALLSFNYFQAAQKVTGIKFNNDFSEFKYNSAGNLVSASRNDDSSTYNYNFSYQSSDKMEVTEQLIVKSSYSDEDIAGKPVIYNVTLYPSQNKITILEDSRNFLMLDKNGYSLNGGTRESYTWKKNDITKVIASNETGYREETQFKFKDWSYSPSAYSFNWLSFILSYYDLPEFNWYWWQSGFWPFSKLPSQISVKKSTGKNFDLILDYYPTRVDGRSAIKIEIKTDVNGQMKSRDNVLVIF